MSKLFTENDPKKYFFSATYNEIAKANMQKFVGDYVYHAAKMEDIKLENVIQFKIGARNNEEKLRILEEVFEQFDMMTSCIIFMNNKIKAEKFKKRLFESKGISAELLLGGSKMSEEERVDVVKRFKQAQFHTLICSNVVSRGFDVPEVDLVINLDLPRTRDEAGWYEPDYETFLHRAGRTGRFGTDGVALTVFKDGELIKGVSGIDVEDEFDEAPMLNKIEEHYNIKFIHAKNIQEVS